MWIKTTVTRPEIREEALYEGGQVSLTASEAHL